MIHHNYMGMGQYLLIPFLVGWTSIYQLFWCSPGVQGFDTLPYNNYGKIHHFQWLNPRTKWPGFSMILQKNSPVMSRPLCRDDFRRLCPPPLPHSPRVFVKIVIFKPKIYQTFWVNYNISLIWIKAIWGWFPLLTMIPVRSQWGRYNLPRNMV